MTPPVLLPRGKRTMSRRNKAPDPATADGAVLNPQVVALLDVLTGGWPAEAPPEYLSWVGSGADTMVFTPELEAAIGAALDWRALADAADPREYLSADDLANAARGAIVLTAEQRRLIEASAAAQDRITEAEQEWIAAADAGWDRWCADAGEKDER